MLVGCGAKKAAEGASGPPPGSGRGVKPAGATVRMYFVPSMETGKVVTSAKALVAELEARTGLHFEVEIPTSYAAVIEAMGAERAEVAWLPPLAYVLAHDKYGVEVGLQCVRNGEKGYKGMIIARADSGISKIEDIAGRTLAYTDAASTSGYLYPSAMLKAKGIAPGESLFAGGHPAAVESCYSKRVDAACVYYSPPGPDGAIRDARKDILGTHPDAESALSIVALTDEIPNDTVAFRKGFDAANRAKIVAALEDLAKSDAGKKIIMDLYALTDFTQVDDAAFDGVRQTLEYCGMAPEEVVKVLEDKFAADKTKAEAKKKAEGGKAGAGAESAAKGGA
jgi:phosphonate transport system substrate-binding protein